MGNWFHHWIYLDLWCPIWPNIAASFVIWLFMWWKHRELKQLQLDHHAEHMAALNEMKQEPEVK